ncbi:hypothetical protein D6817_03370 [Candidatus Pacearchaeota archaeon]|nr:MAG: hypothetical protein D6817_03370 [Candidatus Pacearchaeota archaeon]
MKKNAKLNSQLVALFALSLLVFGVVASSVAHAAQGSGESAGEHTDASGHVEDAGMDDSGHGGTGNGEEVGEDIPSMDDEVIEVPTIPSTISGGGGSGGGVAGFDLNLRDLRALASGYYTACSFPWDASEWRGSHVSVDLKVEDIAGGEAHDGVSLEVRNDPNGATAFRKPEVSRNGKLKARIVYPAGGVVLPEKVPIRFVVTGKYKPEKMSLDFEARQKHDRVNFLPEEYCSTRRLAPTPPVDGVHPELPVVVKLSPEVQVTRDGTTKFDVYIKDQRDELAVSDESGMASQGVKTYELEFLSRGGVRGELEESEVQLSPGEMALVGVTVKAANKGNNPFVVVVKSDDFEVKRKGTVVYLAGDVPLPTEEAFFKGEGYALSSDETRGKLVRTKVVKNGDKLKGTFKIADGGEEFLLDGTTNGEVVKFDLYSPRDGVGTGKPAASFAGKLKRFSNFLLLRGALDTAEGEIWELTLLGRKAPPIVAVDLPSESEAEAAKVEKIPIGKILALKRVRKADRVAFARAEEDTSAPTSETASEKESEQETEKEIYIVPKKVKAKKIFWFIPTGKKVVEAEVVKAGKVAKEVLEEGKEVQIGDYKVRVRAIEGDNVDIEVKRVSASGASA